MRKLAQAIVLLSFRYVLVVFLIAGMFVVIGCECDCAPPEPTLNIRDLIASDAYKQSSGVPAAQALDTLVYYLNFYPDLNADLIGYMIGTTEFTLFAPSNAAFASLKATPGFPNSPDALKRINPQLLVGVLTYHFVEGKKLKAELTPGMELTTQYLHPLLPNTPTLITVNPDGTLKAAPNAANVAIDIVVPDGLATNGVVHVVESVLIPPTQAVDPPFPSVASTVLLSKEFTNIAKVIQAADLAFTENAANQQFRITTLMLMPIGPPSHNTKGITFFALPNTIGGTPVFTEAAAEALIALPDKGRSFLLNHLVMSNANQAVGQYVVGSLPAPNPNNVTNFADSQVIIPVAGSGKRIFVSVGAATASNPYGVAISNDVSSTPPPPATFKPIVLKDIKAVNGVVHAVSGPLN